MSVDLLLWAIQDAIYAHQLVMAHASEHHAVRVRRASARLGAWRMTWWRKP